MKSILTDALYWASLVAAFVIGWNLYDWVLTQ